MTEALDFEDAQFDAEWTLVQAAERVHHAATAHPDDEDMFADAFDELCDARNGYLYASILLEAGDLEVNPIPPNGNPSPETLAYLGALKVIVAGIEASIAAGGKA
jgi:hypothetical protein